MRLRLLFGGLLFGGLLGACNTPSVPLPPPDFVQLNFESKTPGLFDLRGKPSSRHIGVRFFAFDDMTHQGAIVDADTVDGHFVTPEFAANLGDSVELYYESGSRRSDEALCTLTLGALDSNICH